MFLPHDAPEVKRKGQQVSPEVWTDAKAIIEATALDLALPLDLPNEDFTTPEPPAAWVSIDVGGDAAETIELGGLTWEERGAIWVHCMLPFNSGIADGLAWRKAFSVAFRAAQPTVEGLYYRDHSFDPLSSDDGVWRRLSLVVRYEYDDRLTNNMLARAKFEGGSGMTATAA